MKKTILFIDDDIIALRMISDRFKDVFGSSMRYEKASNAEEADQIILAELAERGHLPALIVCDWMLPGKRGDQFMIEIAQQYPEIPLILHSGVADQTLEAELTQKAALLCNLPKPWDGQHCLDKITAVLN